MSLRITQQYNPCSKMMNLKTDELRYKILGFEDKSNSKRGVVMSTDEIAPPLALKCISTNSMQRQAVLF